MLTTPEWYHEYPSSLEESCLHLLTHTHNSTQAALFLQKLFLRHKYLTSAAIGTVLSNAFERLPEHKETLALHSYLLLFKLAPEILGNEEFLNLMLSCAQKPLDFYARAQMIQNTTIKDLTTFGAFMEDFFSTPIDWYESTIVIYPKNDPFGRGVFQKQFLHGPLCLIESLFMDPLSIFEQSPLRDATGPLKRQLFGYLLDALAPAQCWEAQPALAQHCQEWLTDRHRTNCAFDLYDWHCTFWTPAAGLNTTAGLATSTRALWVHFLHWTLPASSNLHPDLKWHQTEQAWLLGELCSSGLLAPPGHLGHQLSCPTQSVLLQLCGQKPTFGWDSLVLLCGQLFPESLNYVSPQGTSAAYQLNQLLTPGSLNPKNIERIEYLLTSLYHLGLDLHNITLRPHPTTVAANELVQSLLEHQQIQSALLTSTSLANLESGAQLARPLPLAFPWLAEQEILADIEPITTSTTSALCQTPHVHPSPAKPGSYGQQEHRQAVEKLELSKSDVPDSVATHMEPLGIFSAVGSVGTLTRSDLCVYTLSELASYPMHLFAGPLQRQIPHTKIVRL